MSVLLMRTGLCWKQKKKLTFSTVGSKDMEISFKRPLSRFSAKTLLSAVAATRRQRNFVQDTAVFFALENIPGEERETIDKETAVGCVNLEKQSSPRLLQFSFISVLSSILHVFREWPHLSQSSCSRVEVFAGSS